MAEAKEEDPFTKIDRMEAQIKALIEQNNALNQTISTHQRLLTQLVTPQPETASKPQNPSASAPWIPFLLQFGTACVNLVGAVAVKGKGGTFKDELKQFEQSASRLARAHQALDALQIVPSIDPIVAGSVRELLRTKARAIGRGAYKIEYEGVKGKKEEEQEPEISKEDQSRIDFIENKLGIKKALGEEKEEAPEGEHKFEF